MAKEQFDTLKEIVGLDGILKLLKDAGEKAGEAKDWEKVSKISNFTEELQAEAAQAALQQNFKPQNATKQNE